MKRRMQREEQEARARTLPVFIYISQHFQLAAARLQPSALIERHPEREREGGLLQVAVAMASLPLEVFARINCVCFGPERNTGLVPSPYFSGYFYRTL